MSRQQIKAGLTQLMILISISLIIISQEFVEASSKIKKDVNRKSIVFDIKTPKVFYCPQEKLSDYTKMIVKAKPLEKLCEFEGKGKPKGSPSDCYNDVDETEFACDEKKRFLLRLDPPNNQELTTTTTYENLKDPDYVLPKGFNKKKVSTGGKKY